MACSQAEARRILEGSSKQEKIRCLEGLAESKDPGVMRLVTARLDDADIEVRGEAFGCLMAGRQAEACLIEGLDSEKRNVRGFCALILANRGDRGGIDRIAEMTGDPESMVRECALGALGFLGAGQARKEIHGCLADPSPEVVKSALRAAADIGGGISKKEVQGIAGGDDELEELVRMAQAGTRRRQIP